MREISKIWEESDDSRVFKGKTDGRRGAAAGLAEGVKGWSYMMRSAQT
jgi:hypothetical protein